MTQMKTRTVNGTTYAVTDAAAHQAIGDLSQLNTVNKTNLTQAINETLAQGAPAIICTASGTCVSVNDAATRRVQQLRLSGLLWLRLDCMLRSTHRQNRPALPQASTAAADPDNSPPDRAEH